MFNISKAVFTPAEKSAAGVDYIQQMAEQSHRAMPLPLPKIGRNQYFGDLMAGEICAIQAQTSNYKSGFISWWERELAKHLNESGRQDEIIIHIDTENSLEALAIQSIATMSNHTVMDLSRGNVRDWAKVIGAAGQIAGINIYTVANSLGNDDTPDLYLSNIYRATKHMANGELLGRPLTPACIFVDYLQALPIDPEIRNKSKAENTRRLQVREDVYRLKAMAQFFRCPVVVGVQAKQGMTGHAGVNMMIPGTYDGEETSSIAQRFDRVVSLWMPKTTHTVGDVLTHKSLQFEVEETMLWLKVNKQRGGAPAGRSWQCEVDYQTNEIRVIS